MTTNEFSRPLALESLGGAPMRIALRAEAGECAALARRFDLVGLEHFAAVFVVRAEAARLIVEGWIEAALTQSCIVTLEPVAARIDEAFRLVFMPIADVQEVELDASADSEDVEPLPEGPLDLGEIAAQHLALAIDPYPRTAGAAWGAGESAPSEAPRAKPFAALARRFPPRA
jgi:uncharacterized metal-binding protein YceD (DUF177 family)